MFKRIWKAVVAFSDVWGLLPSTIATAIAGTVWVILMTVAGILERLPIFWILMGVPVGAAAIVTLVLRVSEWRQRISAAGKFLFHGINLGGDYNKDEKGNVTSIKDVQVRLLLRSTSPYPISFIVDDFQTSFESNYPPNKPRDNNGGIANGHELKAFNDHLIEMKNAPIKEKAAGTAKFTLRYGHPGHEKYKIEHDLTFETIFKPEIGGYVVWGYADKPT